MPGVPVENLEQLWPMAEPHIKKAVEKSDGTYTAEEVKYGCLSGEYILWLVRSGKAAIILMVSEYHNGKQCDILMLGGDDMNEWLDELEEIEGWAKRAGCDRMILTGRKGWQKMLPGYKTKTVTMVKSW